MTFDLGQRWISVTLIHRSVALIFAVSSPAVRSNITWMAFTVVLAFW